MSSHPSGTPARFAYPVVLDLHDANVLVVGGGPVAARKIDGLRSAGARVTVVAESVIDAIDASAVTIRRRRFRPADVVGMRLVVAATGVHDVDSAVASSSRRHGIWVNAADQPVDCDFILPAIARSGRVSATISTDGASPALAVHLRDLVATLLDERVAAAAEQLALERAVLRADGRSTETIDWAPRLAELLATS